MNTGNFAGYLGRDAETKTVGDSTVTNFSIGVSTFKNREKSTLWVSCAMWGERGQKVEQYLTKGSAVTVSGDVDVRAYAAKDGTPKAEIVCNVQRLTLQGNREGSQTPRQESNRAPTLAERAGPTTDPDFNDPCPF